MWHMNVRIWEEDKQIMYRIVDMNLNYALTITLTKLAQKV